MLFLYLTFENIIIYVPMSLVFDNEIKIWLRPFCFGFFRACPRKLLVYAICKEGSPENRKKSFPGEPCHGNRGLEKNLILTNKKT